MLECLKQKALALGGALVGLKDLRVSLKGNAEISLHNAATPSSPKARMELVEDGATAKLTDLLWIGVLVVAVGGLLSAILDLFD